MAPAASAPSSDAGREEQRERYQELLQELRVILPGVQVFFAFLLTAPFAAAFGDLDRVGRAGYAVSVLAAALAVIVLATPTAFHHLGDRSARDERLRSTIRLKVVGLALVGVAASSGLFVVIRFVFGPVWGWLGLAGFTLAWLALWYVLPTLTGRGHGSESDAAVWNGHDGVGGGGPLTTTR